MTTLSHTSTELLPRIFATGLVFGESPRYHAPSETLYLSDMLGRRIYTVSLAGEVNSIIDVDNQPNGMCFSDGDEALVYSSMFDKQLLRYDLKSRVSEPYADLSGSMTGYCGDMVIDVHGRIYIDDTGSRPLHGDTSGKGRLLLVDPTSRAVSSVAENISFPNGIAIDSTGTKLFLGESFAYHLEKFDIAADGTLSNRTTIWTTQELSNLAKRDFGYFCCIDGMAIDAEDGLWLSMLGYEMFLRRDRSGKFTHYIRVDGDATACALGGKDGRTLFLVVNKVPEGETLFDAMKGRRTRCTIYTVEVDVPKGAKSRP